MSLTELTALIMSMQDGNVNMISVNRIEHIEFGAEDIEILLIGDIEPHRIYYRNIRSIVIA